jgi:hypothetical protein
LLVAGCTAGGDRQTTRTTTDTTIAPVKATDTTVVQRTVNVKVDTVKKTHNTP